MTPDEMLSFLGGAALTIAGPCPMPPRIPPITPPGVPPPMPSIPETPAMAVRWATRPDQQTVTGTLANLAARIAQAGLKPPATIVIGDVVARSDADEWEHIVPYDRRSE